MGSSRWVLVCLSLLLCAALLGAGAHAAEAKITVINHVFSTEVVRDEEGVLHPRGIIVGFRRGVASFHTLTQLAFPSGTHQLTVMIVNPSGETVASTALPAVRAQHDDWIETVWVRWTDVPLDTVGRYEVRFLRGTELVARFYLPVS